MFTHQPRSLQSQSSSVMDGQEKPYEPTGNFEKDFKEYSTRNKSQLVPIVASHIPSADSKPKMRVVIDPNSNDNWTALHIAHFAIDEPMARSLSSALIPSTITTLRLWNVALTAEVFQCLLTGIQVSSIKCLALDSNEPTPGCSGVSEEAYAELLQAPEEPDDPEDEPESPSKKPKINVLQTLSLRCNKITDVGAARIADMLTSNRYLTGLDLYGNAITSRGAVAIAKALRHNRTLQTLSIAHNHVTDVGVAALAEVLSEFELTHEEVVVRRKLLSGTSAVEESVEDGKSLLTRSGSTHALTPKKKETVSGKEPKSDKKQRQPSAGKIKGLKEGKGAKEKASVKPQKSVREDALLPLLEQARCEDHAWFIVGNRALVSLNVSANPITAESVGALLKTVRFQINLGDAGLVRVVVQSSSIPKDCKELEELEAIMSSRAPNPVVTPEQS